MKHDENWLDSNAPDESEYTDWGTLYSSVQDLQRYARDYHEHMTRWRSMDEVPEIGDRIEVYSKPIGTLYGEECSGDVFEYDGMFIVDDERKPLFWRPAPLGELPEVSDVA